MKIFLSVRSCALVRLTLFFFCTFPFIQSVHCSHVIFYMVFEREQISRFLGLQFTLIIITQKRKRLTHTHPHGKVSEIFRMRTSERHQRMRKIEIMRRGRCDIFSVRINICLLTISGMVEQRTLEPRRIPCDEFISYLKPAYDELICEPRQNEAAADKEFPFITSTSFRFGFITSLAKPPAEYNSHF